MKTHRLHIFAFILLLLVATPVAAYAAFSISATILSFVGYLTALGGLLLDKTMELFVLGMGSLINDGGLAAPIDAAWTIVRDLVNITFIFGLLYVGIITILGLGGGNTKKMLAAIVIGALLVNFSLFFAKTIVDVSNLAATEIYQVMTQYNHLIDDDGSVGLSGAFMSQMGIIKLVNPQDATAREKIIEDVGDDEGGLVFILIGSIFLLVAAFVFAAGAFLLAIRFGMLIILMALSPVAFAASVLPGISGWSKKWWNVFLKQAFFAPAYLFMLLITWTILSNDAFKQSIGAPEFDQIFAADTINQGVTMAAFFFIMIVGLVASLVVANQMGAYGSKKAIGAGHKLRGYGQRALGRGTFGLAAAGGRGTLGQLGYKLSNNESLSRAQASSGIRGWAARRAMDAANYTGGASFDARRVGNVGKNLNIGEGKKGGFKKGVEEREKKEKKRVSAMGPDERVFDDLGGEVKNDHASLKAASAEREKIERELANTTDPARRMALTQRTKTLTETINSIEKKDSYKAAKATAKDATKRQYAANLEARNRWVPTWLGGEGTYNFITGSSTRNKAAAKSIRKELGKDPNTKLIDAFKDSSEKSSDSGKTT